MNLYNRIKELRIKSNYHQTLACYYNHKATLLRFNNKNKNVLRHPDSWNGETITVKH